MSKPIQYSNEPLDDIEFIPDFLPSPEQLALKKENTKVTISLSSESVACFKDAAKKHHMQYQCCPVNFFPSEPAPRSVLGIPAQALTRG